MKARLWVLAAALLVVSGCKSTPPEGQNVAALRLGTVDVMRVMEERPETVQVRLDWATLAARNYTDITDVKDKAEYEALQKQIAEQSEQWQKRMDAFMEKSITEVEMEAEKLAREKGLDVILVDNPLTKPLKYAQGEDLTVDILFRIQSGGK